MWNDLELMPSGLPAISYYDIPDGRTDSDLSVALAVPEPTTLSLFAAGGLAWAIELRLHDVYPRSKGTKGVGECLGTPAHLSSHLLRLLGDFVQKHLFVLRTGTPWEYLPTEMECGSGMTCWRRLRDWQAAGMWKQIWPVLLNELRESYAWSRSPSGNAVAGCHGTA
jgi:hypothetical protein